MRGGSEAGPMLGIKWQKWLVKLLQVLDPGSLGSLGKVGRLPPLDSPNVLWLDSANSDLPPRFARCSILSHLLTITAVSRVLLGQ